jgi:trigger factor
LNPEIKNLKDFEDQIKQEISSENDYQHNIEVETEILEQLVLKSKFNISEIQIQRSADHIIEERVRSISQYNMKLEDYLKAINKTSEEFYKETLETSEKELKRFILVEEIIKLEKILADEKEIENELKEVKKQYQGQKIADDNTLKTHIENNIKRKKCLEYLINIAKKPTKNRKKN